MLKTDDNYPKRHEIKLKSPQDSQMPILTNEEAYALRSRYSIRRFTHAVEEPKNHLITEYGLKLKTDKPKRAYRKRKTARPSKVASIRIPANA